MKVTTRRDLHLYLSWRNQIRMDVYILGMYEPKQMCIWSFLKFKASLCRDVINPIFAIVLYLQLVVLVLFSVLCYKAMSIQVVVNTQCSFYLLIQWQAQFNRLWWVEIVGCFRYSHLLQVNEFFVGKIQRLLRNAELVRDIACRILVALCGLWTYVHVYFRSALAHFY